MKLIIKITAAIVLAWIVITAAKSVLAYTALAKFAAALDRIPTPATSAPQPAPNYRRTCDARATRRLHTRRRSSREGRARCSVWQHNRKTGAGNPKGNTGRRNCQACKMKLV